MYQIMIDSDSDIDANNEGGNNNLDYLNLGKRVDIRSMLNKEGVNGEKVIFSSIVTKINSKGKKQKRILVITQNAIYNLKRSKKWNKSQRRIAISDIGMVTLSALNHGFVIHVTAEYDYFLFSMHQETISNLLRHYYYLETMSNLRIVSTEMSNLQHIVLTKKMAKFEKKYKLVH